MTNVGIMGLGKIGQLHMLNCLHSDNVNVIAASTTSKKAMAKAKSFGIDKLYADYHDLFNHSSNMDAAIISLPNFLHFEAIQLALEAGLDVLTEKPLANTVKECSEIVRLVKKSGRKLMIGHSMRFINAVEKMKAIKDEGRLGDLVVVTNEQILNWPLTNSTIPTPLPEWWFDPKRSGGGVLMDLGYNMIDLFRFFTGDDVELLFCSFDQKYNLPFEDGAIAILRSQNSSVKGIINVGWYQKQAFPQYNFRSILNGNAGYISSDSLLQKNLCLHALKKGTNNFLRKIVRKKIKPLSYSFLFESYYKELQHFLSCLENDSDPCISAIDGLENVKIIKKAYKTFG